MSAFHSQTLCVKYEHIIIPFAQNSNTYFSLNIIRLVDGFQFPESIDLDNVIFLAFTYFYLIMLLAEYQGVPVPSNAPCRRAVRRSS